MDEITRRNLVPGCYIVVCQECRTAYFYFVGHFPNVWASDLDLLEPYEAASYCWSSPVRDFGLICEESRSGSLIVLIHPLRYCRNTRQDEIAGYGLMQYASTSQIIKERMLKLA